MRLTDLIEEIQTEKLSREKLEELYTELTNLYANYALTLAELEKKEALFLDTPMFVDNRDASDAYRKRKFRATPTGQELIQTKQEVKVIEKYLSSVKHKIFQAL